MASRLSEIVGIFYGKIMPDGKDTWHKIYQTLIWHFIFFLCFFSVQCGMGNNDTDCIVNSGLEDCQIDCLQDIQGQHGSWLESNGLEPSHMVHWTPRHKLIEIWISYHNLTCEIMHLKTLPTKCWLSCLGRNMLTHKASWNLVNIGLVNGSVPDRTKPSPEPMSIYHQLGPMAFTSGARPTKHISIEFEIRWKFKTL